jgi:hypothetical protein
LKDLKIGIYMPIFGPNLIALKNTEIAHTFTFADRTPQLVSYKEPYTIFDTILGATYYVFQSILASLHPTRFHISLIITTTSAGNSTGINYLST